MSDHSVSELGIQSIIPSEQLLGITARADIRRQTQSLNTQLRDFTESDIYQQVSPGVQTKYEKEYLLVTGTMQGDLPINDDGQPAQTKILSYLDKGKQLQEIAPNLAACHFAKAAALQQINDKSYDETLGQAKHLLQVSRDQNIPQTTPADFLPDALIIGIEKKKVEKIQLPSPKTMAQAVQIDPSLIDDYALVLDEEDRETFLFSVAGAFADPQKVRVIGARMDLALSQVVDRQEPQHQTVLDRAKAELTGMISNEIIQAEPTIDRSLVKVLSETLSNLESQEANIILKKVAAEAVEGIISSKESPVAYAARLVRTLSEIDGLTGGSLAIELMGQKELPPHYFDYFREYLQSKGLLVKMVDSAGEKWSEKQCQELYMYLQKHESAWTDAGNVTGPFEKGVEVFGIKRMLAYAGRPDVTPHDALSQFKKVIELQNVSTLRPAQFYSQILNQIKLDGSIYESGLSYHEFNTIIGSIDCSHTKLKDMSLKVGQYPTISKLQELNEYLKDPKEIFSSWFNLRKFSDLSYLLDQEAILKQLESLQKEALHNPQKAKLYDFIEQIAFNKTGKVDMKAVLEFWQDPETFLARGDLHTPKALHDAVKPSNYADVTYINLSSAEIRDALVDGSLDKIQTFKPMEVIYSVDKETKLNVEPDFYSELKNQLGSRQEGTQNSKLFNEVKKILKTHEIDLLAYIINKRELLENLSPTTQQMIQTEVREAIKQFPNEKIVQADSTKLAGKYRARMNYKGDPQAVLAGNDTSCCMPFGSGKNNCYMWNPTVGLFTLEEERGSGWRTIAQSVTTLDVDLGKDISVLTEQVDNDPAKLIEALPENVTSENKRYIACDNIEVATNFISKKELIEAIYRDFFNKYAPYFKEQSGIAVDTDKMIIGKSNSDLSFGTKEKNTYFPVSLVGYSDKLGSQVDVIHFNNVQKDAFSLTEKSMRKNEGSATNQEKQSVQQLTPADTLSVAYLEYKAYPKNMLGGMYKLQNDIFAQSIRNSVKNKKDLSLKYVDSENKMKGYLLVYEGKKDNEEVIFINDWSVDPTSLLAGGRLMNAFVESYVENYITKGKNTPIFMQAREETSYQILRKQLEKISEKLGIHFDMKTGDKYKYGDSMMHEVILRPILG